MIPRRSSVALHSLALASVLAATGARAQTGGNPNGAGSRGGPPPALRPDDEFDLATLAGTVFRDDDGDGRRSPGEPGLPGVKLFLDDGLSVTTDAEGRYHLAAITAGERVLKIARHTLPPKTRFTTDESRVITLSPGMLFTVDFGVAIDPVPLPPAPASPTDEPPRLRATSAGHLFYTLSGTAGIGGQVAIGDREAPVDEAGRFYVEVPLHPGTNRFLLTTAFSDGSVTISTREIQLVQQGGGGSLIPGREVVGAGLVVGAPSEGTVFIEGISATKGARISAGGIALSPDGHGRIEARIDAARDGSVAIESAFPDGLSGRLVRSPKREASFFFLVGLAEVAGGPVIVRAPPPGATALHAEGRVALYARGVISGRALLEGAIDTAQLDFDHIFTDANGWRALFRRDPYRLFRALDPNRFYPVYGDASTTVENAPSRGPLYVRIAVDASEIVIGNVQAGIGGVELGRYLRGATGGRFDYVRASSRPGAPPDTQVILFGGWLPAARAHDELRATGGSLYYLSHRALSEGSEQLRVEVRDAISERPIESRALARSVDYEIDALSGRVILREALSSVMPGGALVRGTSLDGARAWLVADYEYLPETGEASDAGFAGRLSQRLWRFRLGATGAWERHHTQSGGYPDYWLLGGDLSVDLGRFGSLRGEFAHADGLLHTPDGALDRSFGRSLDGGLSFTPLAAGLLTAGNAWKAEGDLHLFGVNLRPYLRAIDPGFSDSAHASGTGLLQYGADADLEVRGFRFRAHFDRRRFDVPALDPGSGAPGTSRLDRIDAGGEVGRRFGDFDVRLGGRVERMARLPGPGAADSVSDGMRLTFAARLGWDATPDLNLYALAQYSPIASARDALQPLARDASLGALGAIMKLGHGLTARGEASASAYGPGGLVGLSAELDGGRVIYGSYTFSQDRDDAVSAGFTAGGRERAGPAIVFAEDQFRAGRPSSATALLDDPFAPPSRAHLDRAGIELPVDLLGKTLLLGAAFERGELQETVRTGSVESISREAGSMHASYAGDRVRIQGRLELRRDEHGIGAVSSFDPLPLDPLSPHTTLARTQWLASGAATLQATGDLAFRARVLLSGSNGSGVLLASATEATFGFAYRPKFGTNFSTKFGTKSRTTFGDGLALLGRYSYVASQAPAGQLPASAIAPFFSTHERAHVASLAGQTRLFWRFSFAEKIALKYRLDVDTPGSAALFLSLSRLDFHLTRRFDAVGEYRVLVGRDPAYLSHGAAVELNVLLFGHARFGVGWNFSDITDNELAMVRHGDASGFFARMQGYY